MNYFNSALPSDYKIYFEDQSFEFNSVCKSSQILKKYQNKFFFETVKFNPEFLKLSSSKNIERIEEYQEIRDINGNKQILKFVYLPTHFTIERTISSNGENPHLIVKWESNTIYDLKIEKI